MRSRPQRRVAHERERPVIIRARDPGWRRRAAVELQPREPLDAKGLGDRFLSIAVTNSCCVAASSAWRAVAPDCTSHQAWRRRRKRALSLRPILQLLQCAAGAGLSACKTRRGGLFRARSRQLQARLRSEQQSTLEDRDCRAANRCSVRQLQVATSLASVTRSV